MSRMTNVSSCVIALACALTASACSPRPEAQAPPVRVTVFEGARLITGDGSPPIENAAFIVEDMRFTRVGRRGDVEVPAGAARVDLTGKTVMPAMIDVHSHLGFLDMSDSSMSKDHFTRENLTDHLERYAYHGFAAVCSFGTDMGDLPFQMRDEIIAERGALSNRRPGPRVSGIRSGRSVEKRCAVRRHDRRGGSRGRSRPRSLASPTS